MGKYIPDLAPLFKAEQIIKKYEGVLVTQHIASNYVTNPKIAVIVVVQNPLFDAAGYAFDENEFKRMTRPTDNRTKQFVLINRQLAEELTKERTKQMP